MLLQNEKLFYICTRCQLFDSKTGEMAEWSNAAVLKTVDCYRSGGSNPSFSAKRNSQRRLWVFCFQKCRKFIFVNNLKQKKLNTQSVFEFLYLLRIYCWDAGSEPLFIRNNLCKSVICSFLVSLPNYKSY